MPVSCWYCSFRSQDKKSLLQHVRDVHSLEPRFSIDCAVCGQCFRVFSSYTSHVSRKHPGMLAVDCCRNLETSNYNGRTSEDSVPSSMGTERDNQDQEDSSLLLEVDLAVDPQVQPEFGQAVQPEAADDIVVGAQDSTMQLQIAAASFLVTLKEKHKITQSAVDYVVEGATNLIQQSLTEYATKVHQLLQPHPSIAEQVNDSLSQQPAPFSNLRSAYLQNKFVEENFPFVKPVEIVLGERWVTKTSGRQAGQLVRKEDKLVYIPILETIQMLLKNVSVSTEVLSPHNSSDGFLRDVCDGQQGGELPFSEQRFLQIMAYWDEVEVSNPLGSRVKIHKLGVFYFTLGNILPKHRSSLKAIYLLALVKSKHLNEYGFEDILQPFITDVNQFATKGIHVKTCGQVHLIKGSLQLFLADTLAAHQVGGFKVGVGFALRKCRHCMATFEQMQTKFRSTEFQLRTPELYDYHCSLLHGPLQEHNSTTYGINQRSPLNKIPHFNVANWQLPQDVMHILLEGVVKQELQLLLRSFIFDKKLFTLSILNARLESFGYGYTELSSKPSPLQINDSGVLVFHQSASQCWLFSRLLPLIIGDLIPDDDAHWDTFLLLHDILALCMAPCISPASISYLEVLIEMHHRSYHSCYPAETITPKMHYVVHFPELIRRFGPLVRYWCMRMEAKNSYTKRAASGGNFKNICLSAAVRHQRLLCSQLINPAMLDVEYEYGPGPDAKPLKYQDPDIAYLLTSKLTSISDDSIIFRPRWMKADGTLYREGSYVVHGYDDILPQFGKIEAIAVVSEEPLLILQCVKTRGLCSHFRSYLLDCDYTNCYHQAFHIPELVDYYPLHKHNIFSQTDYNSYICLKWNLENVHDNTVVQ